MGASISMMYGTQGTYFTPLQSMGASTPTMYGAQEFYSESIGVHAPTTYWGFCATLLFVYSYVIHPDTPILVSMGTKS